MEIYWIRMKIPQDRYGFPIQKKQKNMKKLESYIHFMSAWNLIANKKII